MFCFNQCFIPLDRSSTQEFFTLHKLNGGIKVNQLSIDELRDLIEQAQGACVSIYMPTVKLGAEVLK